MSEEHVYKYAIIRVVPQVEREEFINVGIVLYCAKQKFLKAVYEVNEKRLKEFSKSLDIEEVRNYLIAFQQICEGNEKGGPIGKLPVADRFHWLTAVRSTIIQTSKVHIGLCHEPHEILDRLYNQLVAV